MNNFEFVRKFLWRATRPAFGLISSECPTCRRRTAILQYNNRVVNPKEKHSSATRRVVFLYLVPVFKTTYCKQHTRHNNVIVDAVVLNFSLNVPSGRLLLQRFAIETRPVYLFDIVWYNEIIDAHYNKHSDDIRFSLKKKKNQLSHSPLWYYHSLSYAPFEGRALNVLKKTKRNCLSLRLNWFSRTSPNTNQ